MQDTQEERLKKIFGEPNKNHQETWDLVWSRMQTNLTDPALEPYFQKSVGLHLWQQKYLILPVLLFGSIKKIDSEEMTSGLAIVHDFLTKVPTEDVPRVIQSMHGFVSGSSFYALQLAQLFARLYLNFQKSGVASLVCFTRYRVCRFSAIYSIDPDHRISWSNYLDCPVGLPALLVSQQIKLGPFSFLKYDWQSSSVNQTDLCVALDILIGREFERRRDLVPTQWHPVVTMISSRHRKKNNNYAFASDISLASMTQTDDCPHNTIGIFDSFMCHNFTISIEGGESREVRDWCIASVFPYFATALASGLEESQFKRLELGKAFPTDLLDAIILYSEGGSSVPNVHGTPFSMTKLSPTDYEAGIELFEEYGIHFSDDGKPQPYPTTPAASTQANRNWSHSSLAKPSNRPNTTRLQASSSRPSTARDPAFWTHINSLPVCSTSDSDSCDSSSSDCAPQRGRRKSKKAIKRRERSRCR